MEIGFIGLGIMGIPMSRRLMAGGHSLHSHSPRKNSQQISDLGITPHSTWAEVAKKSEVVFLMVPDTPQVEEVLFSQHGVAAGLSPGKTVVDMSTISPVATLEIAKRISSLGCEFLDAPVSGGDIGAKAGTLTIMVGGPRETFARTLPLFQLMGTNVNLIGPHSHGQICKAANQIMVSLNIEAVAEAFVFAAKAGADLALVRQALMGGFANSRALEVHGERMLQEDFVARFSINLHSKDIHIVLQTAKELGIALPNMAMVQVLMNMCKAHGYGTLDNSALIKALETMADHSLHKQ